MRTIAVAATLFLVQSAEDEYLENGRFTVDITDEPSGADRATGGSLKIDVDVDGPGEAYLTELKLEGSKPEFRKSMREWIESAAGGKKIRKNITVTIKKRDGSTGRKWTYFDCTPRRFEEDPNGGPARLSLNPNGVQFESACLPQPPPKPEPQNVDPFSRVKVKFPGLLDQDEDPLETSSYPFGPEDFETAPYGGIGSAGNSQEPLWAAGRIDGRSAAGIGWNGGYPERASEILVLPPMDLCRAINPILAFRHRFSLESGYDAGKIVVLNRKTGQIDFPKPLGGYPVQSLVVPTTIEGFYTGVQTDWTAQIFDLSPYAGAADVLIGFWFVSDDSISGSGWYIDSVAVGEAQALPKNPPVPDDRTMTFNLQGNGNGVSSLHPLQQFGFQINGENRGRSIKTRLEWIDERGNVTVDPWPTLMAYKGGDEITLCGPMRADRLWMLCALNEIMLKNPPRLSLRIVELNKDGSDGRTYSLSECFPTGYSYSSLSTSSGTMLEELTVKVGRIEPQ